MRARYRRHVVSDPAAGEDIEVRRSARRTRTVSAYRDGGRIVVLVPARLGRAEERDWVDRMVSRIREKESRRPHGDDELAARAGELSRRHFEGRAIPLSVAWSRTQQRRWGSCTPEDRTIRVSDRLRSAPEWVLDYVLVHELAHLLEPSHSARFWDLVAAYPRAERARGWLDGYEAGQRAPQPSPPHG